MYNVMFADDCESFAHSTGSLQQIWTDFNEVAKYYGQDISISKSKIQVVRSPDYEGPAKKGEIKKQKKKQDHDDQEYMRRKSAGRRYQSKIGLNYWDQGAGNFI